MSARADQVVSGPGLVDVLSLERIEADLFRRQPHSLHGYFLSRGDPSRRVPLMVNRDRDGRSYPNRRVIAVQNGVVIFNMAASFHVAEEGPGYQAHPMPPVPPPENAPALTGRTRMLGIEIRVPAQPVSVRSGRRGCGCGLRSSWPTTRAGRRHRPGIAVQAGHEAARSARRVRAVPARRDAPQNLRMAAVARPAFPAAGLFTYRAK